MSKADNAGPTQAPCSSSLSIWTSRFFDRISSASGMRSCAGGSETLNCPFGNSSFAIHSLFAGFASSASFATPTARSLPTNTTFFSSPSFARRRKSLNAICLLLANGPYRTSAKKRATSVSSRMRLPGMKGPGRRLFELGRGFEREGMERTFELQNGSARPGRATQNHSTIIVRNREMPSTPFRTSRPASVGTSCTACLLRRRRRGRLLAGLEERLEFAERRQVFLPLALGLGEGGQRFRF